MQHENTLPFYNLVKSLAPKSTNVMVSTYTEVAGLATYTKGPTSLYKIKCEGGKLPAPIEVASTVSEADAVGKFNTELGKLRREYKIGQFVEGLNPHLWSTTELADIKYRLLQAEYYTGQNLQKYYLEQQQLRLDASYGAQHEAQGGYDDSPSDEA